MQSLGCWRIRNSGTVVPPRVRTNEPSVLSKLLPLGAVRTASKVSITYSCFRLSSLWGVFLRGSSHPA